MSSYNMEKVREAFAAQAAYRNRWKNPPEHYVIKWPKDVYAGHLWRDTVLFQEMLSPPEADDSDTLESQVFGNQLKQDRLSIKHLANLLHERASIYSRHIREITDRLLETRQEISGEELRSPHEATRRKIALEKMLLQLESESRREELDFWKTTHDLRETIFEKAADYQSTANRANLIKSLAGFGGEYDQS